VTITKLKPWWRRWYVAWPTALVVGALIGMVAAFRVQTHVPEQIAPAGDRVQAAIDALRTQRFYVGPEMAYRLTDEQRAKIEDALKSANAPAYLVYWSSQGDRGYAIDHDALAQIMKGVGVDGHYAIVDERQTATEDARGLTDPYLDQDSLKERLDRGLLDYATAMAALPDQPAEKPFDYMGGPGGGLAAGLLIVGFGFPVLLLVVGVAGAWIRKAQA